MFFDGVSHLAKCDSMPREPEGFEMFSDPACHLCYNGSDRYIAIYVAEGDTGFGWNEVAS